MKRVEGRRLDEYARLKPALTDLARVFGRIIEAVAFAHSRNVIHRDLKPSNIMVGTFGEVLVLDWGVAKVLEAGTGSAGREDDVARSSATAGTDDGTVVGTPGYMAPEQAGGRAGEVDARSDVYALGKILAFLLEESLGRDDVPRRLRAICRKATEPSPAERYANAIEMGTEVARYLDGQSVSAYPERPFETAARLAAQDRFHSGVRLHSDAHSAFFLLSSLKEFPQTVNRLEAMNGLPVRSGRHGLARGMPGRRRRCGQKCACCRLIREQRRGDQKRGEWS